MLVIDGLKIGPNVGLHAARPPLGAERVIVEDIATDPLWADLPSAWCAAIGAAGPAGRQPILDDTGTVALGTVRALLPCEIKARRAVPTLAPAVDRMTAAGPRCVDPGPAGKGPDRNRTEIAGTPLRWPSSSDWLWEQDAERRLTFASSNAIGIDTDALIGKATWETITKFMTGEQIAALRCRHDRRAAVPRPARAAAGRRGPATLPGISVASRSHDIDSHFRQLSRDRA